MSSVSPSVVSGNTQPASGPQTVYLDRQEVPEVFRRAFPNYRGRQYCVTAAESVTLDANYWSGGTKYTYRGVDLLSGTVLPPGCDEYGNPFRDPFFVEQQVPRVKKLEARIAELSPDSKWFRDSIHCTWLCAPKSFRFLERILWAVGKGRKPEPDDDIPGFLQAEDTYPDHDAAAEWWKAFLGALDAWWQGRDAEGDVADDVCRRLGERTPVKRWLVRLFARRLRRLEENGEQLTHLVRPTHNHRRGTLELPLAGEGTA